MIVGLTGRIATGKTTVAAILKQLGAAIIDADEIARELVGPGSEALGEIVSEFGSAYLCRDGTLDRRKLGGRVFGDAEALRRLNRIVHPYLAREISKRVEMIRRESAEQPIVVEAAVLFEMGADALVDRVAVTDCSRAAQVARLVERGLGEEEAEARVNSQRSAGKFRERADVVIETEGSLAETRQQVEGLWREHICTWNQQGTGQ